MTTLTTTAQKVQIDFFARQETVLRRTKFEIGTCRSEINHEREGAL